MVRKLFKYVQELLVRSLEGRGDVVYSHPLCHKLNMHTMLGAPYPVREERDPKGSDRK